MRMSFLQFFPALVFVVLLVGCSGNSGDASPDERLQASVEANWNSYRTAHGLPGGGMAVYLETPTGNYFAASGMPGVDQNTRFRIASNTKTFTAAAIMLLHQQGRLDINDFITSNIPATATPYVPNTAQYAIPNKTSIRISHLLSHTAGVFDVTNDNIPDTCAPQPYAGFNYVGYQGHIDPSHQFTLQELIGVDAACNLSYFLPGTGYKYSNTGYSLLAVIIERVSGLTYDQFILQNLITPNGLGSTTIPMLGTDQTVPSPFNPGYVWYNGAFEDMTESNMSANIAEGNIISTPASLARWIKRLVKGQAGPNAASVAAMMTQNPLSGSNNYGLGMSYTAGLGYGHEGAHIGYLSLMDYDPTTDVTTILYFNVWDYANLRTDQGDLLKRAAREARAAVGY